jgi:hypothetical protein
VLTHDSFQSILSLLPRTCHDYFVIFPGEKIKHEVDDRGITAAEHGFGIPGAILKFKPNQDRAGRLAQGLRDG